MATQLTGNNADYDRCMETLKDAETAAVAYLDALVEIRDREFYRIGGYETFEDFCVGECKYAARSIRDMLTAKDVRQQIANDSGGTPPLEMSDAAAIQLASVPKADRLDVLSKAAQANRGKVTAKGVREAKQPMPRQHAGFTARQDEAPKVNGKKPVEWTDEDLGNRPAAKRKPKKNATGLHMLPQHYEEAIKYYGRLRKLLWDAGLESIVGDALEVIIKAIKGFK